MKYKVGDKVKLKSKEGLDELKQQHENLYIHSKLYEKAGSVYTIRRIYDGYYSFEEMPTFWAEPLIEGLVEEETLKQYEVPTGSIKIWDLPEGYIFKDENGNVINTQKIVLEKKKKEYPKTYEECEKVLRYDSHRLDNMGVTVRGYKWELIRAFQILLICRDAYWKIAGEEMELGKPWKPDWMNNLQHKHYISTEWDEIKINFNSTTNKILAFPTKEMRDAFYENFKKDIEFVKELL